MWYRRFIVAMIQERKKKVLSQGNLQSLQNCSSFLEIPHGLEFFMPYFPERKMSPNSAMTSR